MKSIVNYIKVNKNISTSGQPTKKEFTKISKKWFEVIINLAMHNKGALKKEDKIVSKLDMIYIHIPITWKKPEEDRLELFLRILETLQKENKKVFIHCIMNYRVSTFMYLYKKRISKKKDIKFIAPKEFKPAKNWRKLIKL